MTKPFNPILFGKPRFTQNHILPNSPFNVESLDFKGANLSSAPLRKKVLVVTGNAFTGNKPEDIQARLLELVDEGFSCIIVERSNYQEFSKEKRAKDILELKRKIANPARELYPSEKEYIRKKEGLIRECQDQLEELSNENTSEQRLQEIITSYPVNDLEIITSYPVNDLEMLYNKARDLILKEMSGYQKEIEEVRKKCITDINPLETELAKLENYEEFKASFRHATSQISSRRDDKVTSGIFDNIAKYQGYTRDELLVIANLDYDNQQLILDPNHVAINDQKTGDMAFTPPIQYCSKAHYVELNKLLTSKTEKQNDSGLPDAQSFLKLTTKNSKKKILVQVPQDSIENHINFFNKEAKDSNRLFFSIDSPDQIDFSKRGLEIGSDGKVILREKSPLEILISNEFI